MKLEEWKDIPGYEGLYQASDTGKVKSLSKRSWNGNGYYRTKEKIFKDRVTRKGYLEVVLWNNRKPKSHKVHRLVMATFIGPSQLQVNHRNGIKSDNRLQNLEYCTGSENVKHAYKTNLASNAGERHPGHILRKNQVMEIRKKFNPHKYNIEEVEKTATTYGVSNKTIINVIKRITWKHI